MIGLSAIRRFFKRLGIYLRQKEFISENCRRPERNYPLYWLAPTVDRGAKRVQLNHLIIGESGPAPDSKIYYYSKFSKLIVLLLSLAGFKQREGKEPRVRLARIEGCYVVEKGHYGIRLAAFLGRDYVLARVIEYDYASLKKNMFVQLNVYGGIVGVAGGENGTYRYYGVCPENLEVLISRHNVPVEQPAALVPNKNSAGVN